MTTRIDGGALEFDVRFGGTWVGPQQQTYHEPAEPGHIDGFRVYLAAPDGRDIDVTGLMSDAQVDAAYAVACDLMAPE